MQTASYFLLNCYTIFPSSATSPDCCLINTLEWVGFFVDYTDLLQGILTVENIFAFIAIGTIKFSGRDTSYYPSALMW